MKKSLLTLAVGAALGLASLQVSAVVLKDFTVNETSVPGAEIAGLTFVADKVTGPYSEVITFDGAGGFEARILWDATSFSSNDGANLETSLLGSAFDPQYQMYALIHATGTVSGGTFVGGTASLDWYIDPLSDTSKLFTNNGGTNVNQDAIDVAGLTAADAILVGNASDDYLIASSSVLESGEGHIFTGGGANGDFQIIWDELGLTTGDQNGDATDGDQNGDLYFTQPRPFHMMVEASGQLQNFDIAGSQFIVGSVDVTFVPEPGMLALMGLGLLGLGATARRRKA